MYMNFDNKRLESWETIIPVFEYNKEQPFFEMLVPTTDTVRYGYLMEKLLSVRRSVLFTGSTGVGKVRIPGQSQKCGVHIFRWKLSDIINASNLTRLLASRQW